MKAKTTQDVLQVTLAKKLLLFLLQRKNGYLFSTRPFVCAGCSVESERVHATLDDLTNRGCVKSVIVSNGWNSKGHALTVRGERVCDKIEGRDFRVVEEELCRGIIHRLAQQRDMACGMLTDSLPRPKGVGTARMDAAVKGLIKQGVLENQPVSTGFFKVGGYALTPRAIQRIESAKSSHAVLVL
jgi:hypothetical protein